MYSPPFEWCLSPFTAALTVTVLCGARLIPSSSFTLSAGTRNPTPAICGTFIVFNSSEWPTPPPFAPRFCALLNLVPLDPLDAVVKLDHTGQRSRHIFNEAADYADSVLDLQDDVFPKFHGSFHTNLDGRPITCIVTQYCGEPMESALNKASGEFNKTRLILAVGRLHVHGASHGDIYEQNILVKDGNPILIDLEKTIPHKCERRMGILPDAIAPHRDQFRCPELYGMGVWTDSNVEFGLDSLPKWTISSADYLKKFTPTYLPVEMQNWWERQAEFIYMSLKEERMITYGTDEFSKCTKRLDSPSPDEDTSWAW
ncbi:hypothetical protein FB451DRAFT_1401889 [Mycena latifolia]|nr:hypothetical protein FB451DRAFT_1401889 [Mycena latifolia]